MFDLLRLKQPFFPDELEWKPQSCGKKGDKFWVRALAYVTNRAIMDRLDEVVGPGFWKNEFKTGPEGGVLCGLSIKIGDEWVTKWDGSENTDIEAVKGGLSGAMKRAAVQWGIGRYLYDLEENFGEVRQDGIYSATTKEKDRFRWNPPSLPEWAKPGAGQAKSRGEIPPGDEPREEDPPPPPPPTKTPTKTHREEVIAFVGENAEILKAKGKLEEIKTELVAAGTTTAMLDAVVLKVRQITGVAA